MYTEDNITGITIITPYGNKYVIEQGETSDVIMIRSLQNNDKHKIAVNKALSFLHGEIWKEIIPTP